MKILALNKKAKFEYEFIEKFEAGIVLTGAEVKSIKYGKININDAYIKTKNQELFLVSAHISKYENFSYGDHDVEREKKLLMSKYEIVKLSSKLQEKGFSLIPLSIYLKERYIKLEIALARGKKLFDKRESIKKRIVERDVQREQKSIRK